MKLLNKSIRLYIIYSTIIFIIAIPVFYFVIQAIVAEDVDESLVTQKKQIVSKLNKNDAARLGEFTATFEPDISIVPVTAPGGADTIYTRIIHDTIAKENIPYRILESTLLIGDITYRISLRNSLVDSEDLIQSIVLVIGVLLLLIAAGLILINRIVSKKIWRPFTNSLDKLRRYEIEKNESIHFDSTNINEFADLNTTLSSLTARNQQVYQSQKEFTENASHELQTPLAIFQGKVELLMQTSPLNSEQAQLIAELADASQRLNRLNKSLLLLSKISNHSFGQTETVSLKELTDRLIAQYQYQVAKKNLQVILQQEGAGELTANRSLIEILLSNLLSNAIRYSIDGGIIQIFLKNDLFMIRNSGQTTALDSSKIFERFHKGTGDSESIGLGLAIAQRICSVYDYQLTYQFKEGVHVFGVRY